MGRSEIAMILRRLEEELSSQFVGREEEARVAVLALATKQHAIFIGEPGTAKSALIHTLSRLVNAEYFYYLIGKYTTPDELVGHIDPIAFKEGRFVRNTEKRILRAEIAFIDEVFRGSSEVLNTLLGIMNERIFTDADGSIIEAPLWSLYGASNSLPNDSDLVAFYDRFLLRKFVRRIEASSLEEAIILNMRRKPLNRICSLSEISEFHDAVTQHMLENATAVAKVTTQLVVALRQEGIFVSDRTATSSEYLPRLIATYSLLYGRDIRKSAMAVAKYVLPDEESIEAYRKALDSFIPPELREAEERLEKARELAASGDIQAAKRSAAESLQLAQNLLSKPEKLELYKEDVSELISAAEDLLKKITKIEADLRSFREGARKLQTA
ncbi:MAG: AAA family ATPase [Candidatus Korarchaeum sp.]